MFPRIFHEIRDRTDSLNPEGLNINVPRYIVVHSTRSYPSFEELLNYHSGNLNWNGVGYHLFLDSIGRISQGRPFEIEGAHALGFNYNSIGLCIYNTERSLSQERLKLTKQILSELQSLFQIPNEHILSHTQAQIIYFNTLLKEAGLYRRIVFQDSVNNRQGYSNVHRKIQTLIRDIREGNMEERFEKGHQEGYEKIVRELEKFKNCPGSFFDKLV